MKKNIWFILFLLSSILYAQNTDEQTQEITIEDIKTQLKNPDLTIEKRIDNLLILGYSYIDVATDVATKYLTSALKLSKVKKDSFNIIRAYNRFSEQERYLENDIRTLQYADSALQYANVNNNLSIVSTNLLFNKAEKSPITQLAVIFGSLVCAAVV